MDGQCNVAPRLRYRPRRRDLHVARTCRRSPGRRTTSTSGRSASTARRRLRQARDRRRQPGRRDFGKVVSSVSVGGRHEAHHGGFTDDRRYLWAGGLDDSKIFVFDVAADPAKPKLVKTIDDVREGQRRRGRPAHLLRAPRAAC